MAENLIEKDLFSFSRALNKELTVYEINFNTVLRNVKILASVYRYKLACRVFSEGQQSVLIYSEDYYYVFCKLILFVCNMHALSKS